MSAPDAIVYALLAVGVGTELVACLGVAVMRNVHDRLHYLAPSALGAVLITAAIWVREGPSMISLKATLLAGFLLVASPSLAHVTSRTARIQERGDWRPRRDERIDVP